MSRDDTLFKDDDGKAYFISAANENADLMLYELADDYLSIRRTVMKLWTTKREAPAMFKQNGRYFIITSAATGWDPNQAQYSSATNIAGPWAALANLGNGTTYDTQPTYVIPVQGSQATTYIYAGDRWQDPDLLGSKYIWLPLKVSGTTLALDYYADWQLNVTTGVWSTNDGYLPQGGWTLLSVVQRGDGRRKRTRDQRVRQLAVDDLAHEVLGHDGPVPPRDPDRSGRDATRSTASVTCPDRTRMRTGRSPSTSSTRAPIATTGARLSRPERSAAIAARSA